MKGCVVGYTLVFIVVIVAALLGLVFTKNGELAGLGRDHKRGGLRAPHGRLVRTKRLDTIEERAFTSRLAIVSGIIAAITALVFVVCLLGVIEFGGTLAVCAHFVCVVGVAVAVSQHDMGLWRPCAYSVGGYLIAGALVSFAWVLGLPLVSVMSAQAVNMLTAVAGAIGAALGIAMMPAYRTYAREFEDGHVNTIQVSARSTAAKAYDLVLDPAWKPPADRIDHPEYAENPRKSRGGA